MCLAVPAQIIKVLEDERAIVSLGGIAVFTYLTVTGPNQFWPIGLFLIGYALLMVQLYRYMHKDVVE